MQSLCLFVVLLILVQCSTATLNQEKATVRRCNTKYVVECYSITRRLKRGEPYKTNLTLVSRYQWDNNVTLKVVVQTAIPIEVFKIKLCEVSNIKWLAEYLKVYSNYRKCPAEAGQYGLYNMDLPPKNMPQTILKLVKGKTRVSFYVLVTATEEIIVEDSLSVDYTR